ncbi:hypothetical protein [Spirillospora sp. NBC_01491]|uniref:hypothetical protein n=1 Tax=Spirillospora sp. NBC_01491 TaxID=2976007 RepID=UPI002E3794FB|nr:hypothetical protein [Spirillospora sp. NBC_01491]
MNTDLKPRICRTPDECFEAAWEDGEGDRMPEHQIERMVTRHRPYLLVPDEEQTPAA